MVGAPGRAARPPASNSCDAVKGPCVGGEGGRTAIRPPNRSLGHSTQAVRISCALPIGEKEMPFTSLR